ISRSRVRTGSGKDNLKLVNPEDAGRQPFRHTEYLPNPLLRLANELVIDRSRIELHQRQLPFTGDGPRAKTLAAALHPQDDHSARRLQAKLARTVFPSPVPHGQPALQTLQPTHIRQVVDSVNEFPHPRMPQQLLLAFDDYGHS